MIKYFPLIWAGLWRNPVRTVLTMLCIVVAFMLFGLLHGITSSIDEVIDQMSDTRLRIQSRVNIAQGLPIAYLPRIENVSGVTGVAYYSWFGGYYQDPRNQVQTGAIDVDRLFTLYPELQIADEHIEAMRATRTGALMGRDLAETHGWQVGDRVPIGSQIWPRADGSYDWAFDIAGVYTFGDGSIPSNELWINYDYFDEARSLARGTVSLYFARIDDAERSAEIAEDIDALFANSLDETQTQNEKDWIRAQINQVGDINAFLNAIILAVLFTLLFLTGNTMMQSVRERIPELAVLKTYGFGNLSIVTLVVAEAALLCIAAAAVGLTIASYLVPSIYRLIGAGALPMPWSVVTAGIILAALVALVSALPPAWRAQRLDVADALAAR
jgi:putative ABC transport system permease protein